MSALSRIISENARIAIERAKKDEGHGHKNLTERGIARGMAKYFSPTLSSKDKKVVPPPKFTSVYPQLQKLLKSPPEATWDARYVEAFCSYMDVPPERLIAADYDQAKRPATDYGLFLSQVLGKELDPKQIQAFVRLARKIAASPERFLLFEKIADILSSTEDKAHADFEISEAVRRSRSWGKQTPDDQSETG